MNDHGWLGYTESALISLHFKVWSCLPHFPFSQQKMWQASSLSPCCGTSLRFVTDSVLLEELQHVTSMECLWEKSYLFRNAIWKTGLGKEPVEEVTSRQICVEPSHDMVNHSEVQLLPQTVSLEEEAILGKDSHLLYYRITTDRLASSDRRKGFNRGVSVKNKQTNGFAWKIKPNWSLRIRQVRFRSPELNLPLCSSSFGSDPGLCPATFYRAAFQNWAFMTSLETRKNISRIILSWTNTGD